MYELIIFACIGVNLACKDFTDYGIMFTSLFECSSTSPGHVAIWNTMHPKWTIRRWQCTPFGKVAL